MSNEQNRQLQQARAIEWAEYVLPIWEKYYPKDDRPRKAIEAARTNAVSPNAAFTAARARASDAAAAAYAAAYTYAARAAANAAFAAADASVHTHSAAASAARAILLERYGEDLVKARKVLLLKEFIDFEIIKWIDHKPEQFWDVVLETYCTGK